MSWPDGAPAWLKQAFGVIQAGVNANMSTRELTDSLRPYAEASSQGWGPRGVIVMSELRSAAVRIREARLSVERATLSGPITSRQITVAPWARSTLDRSLAPQYQVRALVSYTSAESVLQGHAEGGQVRKWVTVRQSMLPTTLDMLTERIATAVNMSKSLPSEIDTIDSLEILEI